MIILGVKLTHDGSIALIDNGKLLFSYEMEKLNNNPRYSGFCLSIREVENILGSYGYSMDQVDKIVVDGWFEEKLPENIGVMQIADYGHFVGPKEDIFKPLHFYLEKENRSYTSYMHVAGHIAGAYCTSPFSAERLNSFVLVWDGGMPPQLFYYEYDKNSVSNLGSLFMLTGDIYLLIACAFKPFSASKPEMSIAGKAMAYVAVGKINDDIMKGYRDIYNELMAAREGIDWSIDIIYSVKKEFVTKSRALYEENSFSDEDMLTTFQYFIDRLLVETLEKWMMQLPGKERNICLCGGCALNIKWNNSVRASGIFDRVWTPPFPNDSGSAIGTACCEMMVNDGLRSLEWSVYSGPPIRKENHFGFGANKPNYFERYLSVECSLPELASVLHSYNEPVIFLNGRAELGPRSLGNRSILSPASSPDMKKRLNEMKKREHYRPVAPICLEEKAQDLFFPGTPDPYMLYEHFVNREWKERIPAICHLDGSARLQTINKNQNLQVYTLLRNYFDISGIPVLCNTSANLNGSGFFPDVESAMKWNYANLIWSDGILFVKKDWSHSSTFQKRTSQRFNLL